MEWQQVVAAAHCMLQHRISCILSLLVASRLPAAGVEEHDILPRDINLQEYGILQSRTVGHKIVLETLCNAVASIHSCLHLAVHAMATSFRLLEQNIK